MKNCSVVPEVKLIIWDKLINRNELYGVESANEFLHVSTLDIYKNLSLNKSNVE